MAGIAALVDEAVDQFEAGAFAAPVGVDVARIAGERDRGQFIEGAARHCQRSAVAAQGTRDARRSVPRAQAVWQAGIVRPGPLTGSAKLRACPQACKGYFRALIAMTALAANVLRDCFILRTACRIGVSQNIASEILE
jgi:hypothetical protein